MNLTDLKPNKGSKHRRKRLGCGESSGRGKTSGRGGKGQSARSGGSRRIGFEGGQMPLIRRLPKRGFNNGRFQIKYYAVNLSVLEGNYSEGETVSALTLKIKGLVSRRIDNIKILGTGTLSRKLVVEAAAFSAGAKVAIEKVGGTAKIV